MPILDDSDMQDLADLFEDVAMKDDCLVRRPVKTPSSYGNTDSLEDVATVKGMRKKPGTRLIELYADRIGDMTAWEVSLPKGQEMQEGYVLTMGGDNMEVLVLLKQTWEVSTDVIAVKIKG